MRRLEGLSDEELAAYPLPEEIEQAISNVLARHKSEALNLAGTGLAVRAAAGLAV